MTGYQLLYCFRKYLIISPSRFVKPLPTVFTFGRTRLFLYAPVMWLHFHLSDPGRSFASQDIGDFSQASPFSVDSNLLKARLRDQYRGPKGGIKILHINI